MLVSSDDDGTGCIIKVVTDVVCEGKNACDKNEGWDGGGGVGEDGGNYAVDKASEIWWYWWVLEK